MNEFNINSIGSLPAEGNDKNLLVLFVVDATRSMDGQPIAQVNVALQEMLGLLRDFATGHGINVKLAIWSFTNGVKTELTPVDIQVCYGFERIQTRAGSTKYSEVYYALKKHLVPGDLIEAGGRIAPPLLIFLTDGAPDDEYAEDLDRLKENLFFANATRSAVLLGTAAEDPKAAKAVSDFTGPDGRIVTAGEYTKIVDAIKLATIKGISGPAPDPGPGPAPDPGPGPAPDPGPDIPPWPGPDPGPDIPPWPGPDSGPGSWPGDTGSFFPDASSPAGGAGSGSAAVPGVLDDPFFH